MIILKQSHETKVKTIKSNLLKYDKKSDQIFLKIEIPKKTISAKITS